MTRNEFFAKAVVEIFANDKTLSAESCITYVTLIADALEREKVAPWHVSAEKYGESSDN